MWHASWHDSLMCVMTDPCVWSSTTRLMTCCIHMRRTNHPCTWHDSSLCDTQRFLNTMRLMICGFICRLQWCSLKRKKTPFVCISWLKRAIGLLCILEHVYSNMSLISVTRRCLNMMRRIPCVAGCCRALQGVAGCCRVCCIVNIRACCCIHLVCCGLRVCLSTGVEFLNKFVYGVKKQCLLQVYWNMSFMCETRYLLDMTRLMAQRHARVRETGRGKGGGGKEREGDEKWP